jgi:hypothetical protein
MQIDLRRTSAERQCACPQDQTRKGKGLTGTTSECGERAASLRNHFAKSWLQPAGIGGGLKNRRCRTRRSRARQQCHWSVLQYYGSPSTVCDSSLMMRSRAMAVRSIKVCRRDAKSAIDGWVESLARRSSTQASVLACTMRTTPMWSRPVG